MSIKEMELETKLAHGCHTPDSETRSLTSPIYQTATYGAVTQEHFEDLCYNWGHVYARESNPTTDELARTLALIEGCETGVVTSSGMGAVTSMFFSQVKSGDHIICANGMFSHTTLFVKECLMNFGVEADFVDTTDYKNVERCLKPNTKIVYVESPLNPSLRLVDIEKIANLKEKQDFIFVVDSTFAPNPIQYPTKLGADLVIHSLTKFLNGHGDAIGGAVLGKRELIHKIKWPSMPCFTGACLAPMTAWLILRGVRTLDMRVERHCKNALAIAEFLESHPLIENVNYPGLKSSPDYELCQKQMNGMGGGMLSFTLKKTGTEEERVAMTKRFINKVKLITIATSLGEGHTLISLYDGGLVRIAVGLEKDTDLIADLRNALNEINEGER